MESNLLVGTGTLSRDALKDEVVVVTGGGRGIGFETCRSLLWLGAKVVIAEIDEKNGNTAAAEFASEFGVEKVLFLKTDVSRAEDVERLRRETVEKFGRVDAVLNNATIFSIGAVKDQSIEAWDRGYQVNLRGPVLFARTFLPDMIARKHGVFVCVSSSGAAPYMGAYEVFKTAQVELANTIAPEVEESGVYAFTIGPGIVRTPGFLNGGAQVAKAMGISLDQLLEMNKQVEISPEAAGAGFAASIALASKYHGQETSAIQVLRDIGIVLKPEEMKKEAVAGGLDVGRLEALYQPVWKTYSEQSKGWKERSLFQRQWVSRDFKKNVGMSVDEMLTVIQNLGEAIKKNSSIMEYEEPLRRLLAYYQHQQVQLKGFEKDPEKLQENLGIIDGWIHEIDDLLSALSDREVRQSNLTG